MNVTEEKNFDEEWYVKTYQDVLSSDIKPLDHYNRIGRHIGRIPNQSCIFTKNELSFTEIDHPKSSLKVNHPIFKSISRSYKSYRQDISKHLNRMLECRELPKISIENYLLFREDLRLLRFDKDQAVRHLKDHGFDELIEEEKTTHYKIRRHLDLNDSPVNDFAILLVNSDINDAINHHVDQCGVNVFRTNINQLTVYVNEIDISLDIQEFASWLYLRKKIPYLCIIDVSDMPIDGWQLILRPYLNKKYEVIFSEEYVTTKKYTRHIKRYRQHKSKPSQFRILTRGYVSGIFAVSTTLLSRLNTKNNIYQNTWCLQVDITQQANKTPFVVDIPLMVRDQTVNSALLEYGDESVRDYFRNAWKSFLYICKKNLGNNSALIQDFPIQIEQGESGEIILTPKEKIKKYLVSIIIPFKDKVELLEQCIASLQKYENFISYEVILADNGSVEPKTNLYIKNILSVSDNVFTHVIIDEPFNYSKLNNLSAQYIKGDYILLLNNDIEFCNTNPISRMASYLALENVGAVGATLLFPDLSIQHSGIVITPFEPYDTFSPYKATRSEEYDCYPISLKSAEEWSAATAACLLVRKEIWDKLNGLDEDLTVAYNDVDFCFRIRDLGKSIISIPGLGIMHHESKSRGDDSLGEKYNRLYKEGGLLRSKNKKYFSYLDPFWPKTLSVSNPRATVRYHDNPVIIKNRCECEILHKVAGFKVLYGQHYCVYVGFDHNARLRPDVLHQIRVLSKYYNIIYVTSSHEMFVNDPLFEQLQELTFKIIIRKNEGYDFGSWRTGIIELGNKINQCDSILLMNDSLYGPINSFESVIERTLSHNSDIVCMTKNMVGGEHAQSYYVSYKGVIARSKLFDTFWKTLPVYGCKYSIIKECEINWSQTLITAGYKITALFDTGCHGNQTHINWKELILVHGFPFVKNELIMRNPTGQNLNGIHEIMQKNADLHHEMINFWNEINANVFHLNNALALECSGNKLN